MGVRVYKIVAMILLSLPLIYLITSRPKPAPSRDPNHSSLPLVLSPTPVLPLLPENYLTQHNNPCWRDASDAFRCLPKVYLAGMPKCGTTDLYSKLVWHPELVGMQNKENHYWNRGRMGKYTDRHHRIHINNGHQPIGFRYYLDSMNTAAEQIEANESVISISHSPSLLWDMLYWESMFKGLAEPPFTNADVIRDVTPQAKVLVVLRNPVERLYSDFLYFGVNRNPATFHEAVVAEVERFNKCLEGKTLRTCCYATDNDPGLRLNLGVYYCYVTDWYNHFKDLQVVRMEEYAAEPVVVLLRLYSWLDLPQPNVTELEHYVTSSEIENTRSRKPKSTTEGMRDETRGVLEEFYRPYNKLLAELLDDTRLEYNN